MQGLSRDQAFTLATTGGAMLAGLAARNGLQVAWRRSGYEPPVNPDDPDVRWRDALLWAALSGLFVAVARVVARRFMSGAFRKFA